MLLFEYFLVICSIFWFSRGVYALGEDHEISYYDENKTGRLYNVGTKQYLTVSRNPDDGVDYLRVDEDSKLATRLYIRIVRDKAATHALLISHELEHEALCKKSQNVYGSGNSDDYLECPAFKVDSNGGAVLLDRYNPSTPFSLFFSPVVVPNLHAFRIFNDNKCLTVRSNSELFAESCDTKDPINKANQLFIWVEDSLFSEDYDPSRTIDESTNPADPYFIRENPNNNTVWKKTPLS